MKKRLSRVEYQRVIASVHATWFRPRPCTHTSRRGSTTRPRRNALARPAARQLRQSAALHARKANSLAPCAFHVCGAAAAHSAPPRRHAALHTLARLAAIVKSSGVWRSPACAACALAIAALAKSRGLHPQSSLPPCCSASTRPKVDPPLSPPNLTSGDAVLQTTTDQEAPSMRCNRGRGVFVAPNARLSSLPPLVAKRARSGAHPHRCSSAASARPGPAAAASPRAHRRFAGSCRGQLRMRHAAPRHAAPPRRLARSVRCGTPPRQRRPCWNSSAREGGARHRTGGEARSLAKPSSGRRPARAAAASLQARAPQTARGRQVQGTRFTPRPQRRIAPCTPDATRKNPPPG